jgi:hypothetical protein
LNVRYTNVSQYMAAIIAARQSAQEPLPVHCLRIGATQESATGNFNEYFPGTWPAEIFDVDHYDDVGYLAVAELGEAQDCRETLAGRGLYFVDWTPE